MSLSRAVRSSAHEREILSRDAEILKLRNKLNRAAIQNKELHKQVDAERDLAQVRMALESHKHRERVVRQLTRTKGEATAVLVCNDWHVGAVVDPDTVNGLNEYNCEIAIRRVDRVFEKMNRWMEDERKRAKIDTIIIGLLGDFIDGSIHQETKETNEITPIEQTLLAFDMIADGIAHVIKHSQPKTLVVPCCCGNHGRTTHKKQIHNYAKTSHEWGMYKRLAKHFQQRSNGRTDVQFVLTQSYHNIIPVYGYPIRFHHGDFFKSLGGDGGPATAINRRIGKWNRIERIKSSLDVFGHLHQEIMEKRWVLCPSVLGMDPYAMSQGYDDADIGQEFILLTPKRCKAKAETLYAE